MPQADVASNDPSPQQPIRRYERRQAGPWTRYLPVRVSGGESRAA